MKGQAIEIIKDLIASILIVISIGIILSIIFYDDIAIGKVIPVADEYALSDEMKKELEDSKLDSAEEIIVNYYIDASDLKKYEKTNQYIKGKSNPFAEISENEIGNNTATGDNNESSNNSNSQGGFYEDDGTK